MLRKHSQALAYLLFTAIYNRYLHPLSKYPGPVLASISRLPQLTAYVKGRSHLHVKALHDRYGNVVRIAPDELSFREGDAWKDIYGNRPQRKANFLKDMRFYNKSKSGIPNLAVAPTEEIHQRQRRVIGRAFSDAALKDQEILLQSYVRLLLEKLDEKVLTTSNSAAILNIVEWYHYVTFDFMTEFIFGESFGCLQDSEYHPWVGVIVDTIKAWPIISATKYLSIFAPVAQLVAFLFYRDVLRRREESFKLGLAKLRKRLSQGEHNRNDFISYIHSGVAQKSSQMSLIPAELDSNASFLVLAGSETTSTFLCGCTFQLLRNRDAYTKLTHQLRDTFSDISDITFASLSKLPYLDAVIKESFRMHPSAPLGMPRRVPAGNATICGNFVPEGVRIFTFLILIVKSCSSASTHRYRLLYHIGQRIARLTTSLIRISSSRSAGSQKEMKNTPTIKEMLSSHTPLALEIVLVKGRYPDSQLLILLLLGRKIKIKTLIHCSI